MNGLRLTVASQLWIAYSSWILLNLDSFLVFFFFFFPHFVSLFGLLLCTRAMPLFLRFSIKFY
jgi:hypothetical protein